MSNLGALGHVADTGQDWCDSCHAYFTKRTVSTVRTPSKPSAAVRGAGGAALVPRPKAPGANGNGHGRPAQHGGNNGVRKQHRSVYKCKHCDKVFQLPNSLYGHMRVHTELRAPKTPTGKGTSVESPVSPGIGDISASPGTAAAGTSTAAVASPGSSIGKDVSAKLASPTEPAAPKESRAEAKDAKCARNPTKPRALEVPAKAATPPPAPGPAPVPPLAAADVPTAQKESRESKEAQIAVPETVARKDTKGVTDANDAKDAKDVKDVKDVNTAVTELMVAR